MRICNLLYSHYTAFIRISFTIRCGSRVFCDLKKAQTCYFKGFLWVTKNKSKMCCWAYKYNNIKFKRRLHTIAVEAWNIFNELLPSTVSYKVGDTVIISHNQSYPISRGSSWLWSKNVPYFLYILNIKISFVPNLCEIQKYSYIWDHGPHKHIHLMRLLSLNLTC